MADLWTPISLMFAGAGLALSGFAIGQLVERSRWMAWIRPKPKFRWPILRVGHLSDAPPPVIAGNHVVHAPMPAEAVPETQPIAKGPFHV